jgi:Fe2+ or Zn2+ uptake regulation protein
MSTQLEEVTKSELKRVGLHFTKQRALVLEILNARAGHLDAYEVHEETRRLGEKMSLSTVYRILQAFRDRGLIIENHLGEDHHHYESALQNTVEEHHHAVCTRCGAIVEFQLPANGLALVIDQLEGFLIEGLSIDGICPKCQREEGKGERRK